MRGGRVMVLTLALLAAAAAAEELSLRKVLEGPQSGVRAPKKVAIGKEADWTALWRQHAPSAAPRPQVDFSKETVLAVFMGQKPTSGYGIRIRQAAVEKGKLVVRVTERRPPPDAITAQVITAPFHIVAVKKTDLPVTWEADPQK